MAVVAVDGLVAAGTVIRSPFQTITRPSHATRLGRAIVSPVAVRFRFVRLGAPQAAAAAITADDGESRRLRGSGRSPVGRGMTNGLQPIGQTLQRGLYRLQEKCAEVDSKADAMGSINQVAVRQAAFLA